MFVYANGFHVSVKNDQSEVLIRFVQNAPAFERDAEDVCNTQQEVVSSVVLSGSAAKDLVSMIQGLMDRGAEVAE